jgi:hypothetical protein
VKISLQEHYRAKRQGTSESWIAAIFFVMNLVRLTKSANIFFFFILLTKKVKKVVNKINSSNKALIPSGTGVAFGWSS